ncbi:hypothetical protein MsAg5_10320 [Methanosarcinaceae archaeon Ag5]|uniref:Uncharacterized protein n=1 Tax=Methanolapillus africanus TaxID=3028297 RepID=A0AAE4MJS1_9EURY|nr:hypothetical protein [Methanosarcinaceae archaeon Ag5]
MVHELLITMSGQNAVKELQPVEIYRLLYNGNPLPDSTLSTSLPFFGCKIFNQSSQNAYAYFNNGRDKGDVIDAGRERIWEGFSLSDIYIQNVGDDVIPRDKIKVTIYSDHASILRYLELQAIEKRIGKELLSKSLVGGGV